MSTVIQASTEIHLEDAAVARKKPEESTDRELVARLVDQARAEHAESVTHRTWLSVLAIRRKV
ncbi:hypothetical protein [Nonomuraea candida]|uniref:hypothetical protein n=1 Tax=Nonomuraea candida TaxID=359159 RepID=UPI0005B8892D|nr:hypothetical protein [Nonomuraea candida]